MAERIYLDWNATAPLRPQAREALQEALAAVGNPSSVHAEGRAARRLIEHAREDVAHLVAASPADVIFTASGTEANMLALSPAIETASDKRPRDRLFISAIEHSSVRAGGRFAREAIEDLPVDSDGRINLAALADAMSRATAQDSHPLVSIMLANNETGVVQPVAEAAAIVHAANGLLHVDAVQGVGRIPCDIGALGADLLTLSAHKIGGVKGVGALVRARDDIHFADPLVRGGGQERGLRAGTENVAGIAAFGAAAAGARQQMAEEASGMLELRRLLESGLKAISPSVVIFGAGAERLPNTTLFAVRWRQGRNRCYRFRPRRCRRVVRGGLFVGKSAAFPCACCDGGFAVAHPRGRPRQPRLDHDQSRCRNVPRRLEKARNCII